MKKYKLLKDIIGAKAGTIFITQDSIYSGAELVEGKSLGTILDLIACMGVDNKEWFEEIEEVKSSIYDLEEWAEYYYINEDQNVEACMGDVINDRKYGEAFLTKEEAETELEKRKAMAAIKKWSWENDGGYEFKCKYSNSLIYSNEYGLKVGTTDELYLYTPYYSSIAKATKAIKELELEYKILFDIK